MAIDSAEKRRAISGILPFFAVGVTPTAGKDQEWRQEAGFGYPGILAGNPVAGTFQPAWARFANVVIQPGAPY